MQQLHDTLATATSSTYQGVDFVTVKKGSYFLEVE